MSAVIAVLSYTLSQNPLRSLQSVSHADVSDEPNCTIVVSSVINMTTTEYSTWPGTVDTCQTVQLVLPLTDCYIN